ncbi:hypothetical protein EBX93_15305 [bacterium]|nr:hypothetical protein [bacterium]
MSAPRPGLRAEVPAICNVPAPAREPTESLPSNSQIAPAAMTTGAVSAIRFVEPSVAIVPPLTTLPAAMMSGPVKALPPANVSVPGPVLVSPPE